MRLLCQILESRHSRLHGIVCRTILLILAFPLLASSAPPLFARFTTDRDTLYSGEAFQLTLSIYVTGANLDKQVSISNLPAPTALQVRSFEELPVENTSIDGLSYEVRPFRTWARATHAGRLVLAPELNGTLIQTTRSFFLMQESRRSVRITAESFVLTIRPLPAMGRPVNFSGLVGQYSFLAVATPLDIALGDLITLTLTVEGDWIPEDFIIPRSEGRSALKVYDAKIAPENSFPVKRVYQQTVVPQDTSCTAVPAISFCYFDTRSESYVTKTVGPFPISYHAERSPNQQPYLPPPSPGHTSTTNASSDPDKIGHASESLWRTFWNRLSGNREAIIHGSGDVSVRLAPSESSSVLFVIKPGTPVSVEATHGDWLRIACPKGIGWLRNEDVR